MGASPERGMPRTERAGTATRLTRAPGPTRVASRRHGRSRRIASRRHGRPATGPPLIPRTPQESAEGWQPFCPPFPSASGSSEDNLTAAGDATITEPMRAPGSVLPRPSVLATVADCVAGRSGGLDHRSPPVGDPGHRGPADRTGPGRSPRGQARDAGRARQAGTLNRGRRGVLLRRRNDESRWPTATSPSWDHPAPKIVLPPSPRGMRTVGTMEKPFPEHVGAHIIGAGRGRDGTHTLRRSRRPAPSRAAPWPCSASWRPRHSRAYP